MLPPNNESITKIAREEGLSEQTLRNWRDKARKEGYAVPGKDAVPDDWSNIEAAYLNPDKNTRKHLSALAAMKQRLHEPSFSCLTSMYRGWNKVSMIA